MFIMRLSISTNNLVFQFSWMRIGVCLPGLRAPPHGIFNFIHHTGNPVMVLKRKLSTMGKLDTHVLDISSGKPAANVSIKLYQITASGRFLLRSAVTNADGRCDAPLLAAHEMQAGQYELVFGAGDYFAAQGIHMPVPRFIDFVTLAFGIADAGSDYHVPLLMSPWSYSTYRGS